MQPSASPVDGVVVERLAEPGDMAMPGKPLVRLYDEKALRVELEVPDDLAREHRTIGTPLDVSVDATGCDVSHPAKRNRAGVGPREQKLPGSCAAAERPASSSRECSRARPLRSAARSVITAPRDAIEEVGQLETVRVVSEGRIETQMVSLGRRFGDRVEVLAGLRAGERVILDSRGADAK